MKIAVKRFHRHTEDETIEEWVNSHDRILRVSQVGEGDYIRVFVEYMEQEALLEE